MGHVRRPPTRPRVTAGSRLRQTSRRSAPYKLTAAARPCRLSPRRAMSTGRGTLARLRPIAGPTLLVLFMLAAQVAPVAHLARHDDDHTHGPERSSPPHSDPSAGHDHGEAHDQPARVRRHPGKRPWSGERRALRPGAAAGTARAVPAPTRHDPRAAARGPPARTACRGSTPAARPRSTLAAALIPHSSSTGIVAAIAARHRSRGV